ncbi:MAG: hypothetical protein HOH33_06670 [Verrucomicrobia bacterium]|nr:hypothetical protein [Verrucomicrobiota bacterium]
MPAVPIILKAQTAIPPSFAAPAGSINTSESGFLVRVHQLPGGVQRDPRHDIETVELQLAGELKDGDGVPYENEADFTDTSYQLNQEDAFIVVDVINFSDATDPFLDTIGNEGNFTPDDKYPGIPGFGNGENLNDDFAMEILTFLDLKAGLNRIGVNSNEGFRFTIGVGTNTKDAFAVQPDGAVFGAARGGGNTEWELEVEQAGIYPIRLIHWDGGGLAAIEFYSMTDQERILINDSSNANAIKAYRTATGSAPTAISVLPRPGATGIFPRPTLSVQLEDGQAQINTGSISLSFDGTDVTGDTTVQKNGSSTVIRYLAPDFLAPHSSHNATLQFSDTNDVMRKHTWSFEIAHFVNLTADLAYPIDAKDTSAPGFLGTVRQAREGAGLAASVARANAQIRDTLVDPFSGDVFDNEASSQSFTVDGVVNFLESLDEAEQPEKGNFTAPDAEDSLFPGIPGSGGHDNQYAVEISTYLELQTGLYAIGVNSQDGFQLATGADARDVFNILILGQAEGTRAIPEDDVMILNVEADGLYSFRLMQFESSDDPIVNFTIPTDGGALEFFSLDPNEFAEDPQTAQKILINDSGNANSIKAWQKLTSTEPAYVHSVFPAPDATSVAITTKIEAIIENLPNGTAVTMKVNGEEVSARVSRGRTVTYQPADLFERGATVQVELAYGDVSNTWEFTTSTGEVAILITNVGEKESDLAIKAHLEQQFGFDVLLIDDDTVDTSATEEGKFLIEDAQALDVKLVYVSSPVNSNKAGAQPWHASGIPLVNVEQADIDNFQYASGAGAIANNVTAVVIQAPGHPIAAGFPEGEVSFTDGFLPGSSTGSHHAGNNAIVTGDTVTVVATLPGGQAGLVGFDNGTELLDGTVTTARIAHLAITGDDQFRSFNENGLKLFDALIAWLLEIDPPTTEPEVFSFNAISLQGGQISLSWEGQAALQEAAAVTGPWRNSTNQANPQSTPAEGTKFFRLIP